jgi:hypothetical protein
MFFSFIVSSLLMAMPLSSSAEMEHGHEDEMHHQYDAHEHGSAILNWVMEGEILQMSLKSPVINMLGFEHEPHDDSEQQQLNLMIENLNNTIKVFELTGGECELESVSVINPFEKALQHEKIEHSSSDEEMHSEVNAEYQFFCQQPSQLKTIEIKLFDTFVGFELIDAQWIVDGKQGSAKLNIDNHTLKVH